jgi:Tol biopolymer transport system component
MDQYDDATIETPGSWSVSRRRALQLTGGLAAGTLAASPTAAIAATPTGTTTGTTTGAATSPGSATVTEGTNFMVAVSPDGRLLAFDLVTAIWVLDAHGGTAKRLTDDLQDATRPRWSPDGSRLVFQSYRDGNFHLWTIGLDGSGLRLRRTNFSTPPTGSWFDTS